ncbi:hypothetical protein MKX03_021127 [Papaver bracteatum]|nr:hypothetical protein MKX03_021127 [Papaver bracteatum]
MSIRGRGFDLRRESRLTDVAVVSLKKHGFRFEIICFINHALSWRYQRKNAKTHCKEEDINEVLRSDIVYSNASKRSPAKSKDLVVAFQTDDLSKICIKILQNGEFQSESQLSRQFREIATIIMQETFNPEIKRPYTFSMIEKLMHGIHFVLDPHNSSKNQESLHAQALRVIRELQKRYPIKRAPMVLRLSIPVENSCSLMEKLNAWNAEIVSKVESGNQLSLVCEVEPSFFRHCDVLVRSLYGWSEILDEKDTNVDDCDDWDVKPSHYSPVPLNTAELDEIKLSDEALRKQSISTGNGADKKQSICTRNYGTDKTSAGVEVVEILQNGEFQSESQLSWQFRDIAAIIMQKTFNPETKRRYTLSMIEKLMHGIHFSVDPRNRKNSKNQVSEVIHELQRCYPIKRAPMRLRLTIPEENACSLMKKLNSWNAEIVSKVESENQPSLVCEMEPTLFRDYDAFVRSLYGRLEILALSVHFEKDTDIDHYDDHWDVIEPSPHPPVPLSTAELNEIKLSEVLQKQSISPGNGKKQSISTRNDGADERNAGIEVVEAKQRKCSTCNAFVGDTKQYREHFKSSWHTYNLRRKTRELPPLTADECLEEMAMGDANALESDLKEYIHIKICSSFAEK